MVSYGYAFLYIYIYVYIYSMVSPLLPGTTGLLDLSMCCVCEM
jgi:hypothetical protein